MNMYSQVIHCDTLQDLVEVCAALTREGITFKARTSTLEVMITGF